MNEDDLAERLCDAVRVHVQDHLLQQPRRQVLSVDWMEALVRTLLTALAVALFDVWKLVVEQVAKDFGLVCPGCNRERKCKRREGQPMLVKLLGLGVALGWSGPAAGDTLFER